MYKKVYLIIFLIIIIISCSKNTPIKLNENDNTIIVEKDDFKKIMYINSPNGLRVRNSPSISGDIIDLLEFLTKVEVINEDNNFIYIDGIFGKWVNIGYPVEGWVFNGYLSEIMVIDDFNLTDKDLENMSSLWEIITSDSKYMIIDYGTAPPPRFVVIKSLESGEIIFSGNYYRDINLQGHTIEIVKNFGEYYSGKWSLNKRLNEKELNFAKEYIKANEPPEDIVKIADLAQGNGLGLLIVFEYNFITKEYKIIDGKYIRTM